MSREYPERPLVGVGVVVWHGERVLLVRRGKSPRLGQWSLPGGAQRLGETVAEAARREVEEETGLQVKLGDIVATVDLIERDPEGRVRYHYTLIDFVAEAARPEVRPGGDAADARWFSLAEIEDLGLWSETVRVIRLAADRRPCR
ncbi:MAG TPA: NUDIX domain-containing protein [Geminicoccaceae bacterium]|nr:NUDIX domain-containing protein [Geminicoccaceae bacterium]